MRGKLRPEPPVGCQVKLIEDTSERMVFSIPAGGPKTRSLGVMALVWNGFIGWVVSFLLLASLDMPLALLFLPFVTLFMLAGLYLAGSWVCLKFTRTNVLLTQEELAVQKILGFHKQIDHTTLNNDSNARLVESYSQNDTVAYRIEVDGTERSPVFGTALGREDKTWLVESINGFLGRETRFPLRSDQGKDDKELPFDSLAPSDLPARSRVAVSVEGDRLTLQTPSTPVGPASAGLAALAWFTVLFWAGLGLWQILAVGSVLSRIVGGLLLLCTIVPLAGVLLLKWGSISVTIDPREFATRIHVGMLGKQFRRPTPTAERIRLTATDEQPSENSLTTTIVQLGSSQLLAAWGTLTTCREVAGLIRHHLNRLDIERPTPSPRPLATIELAGNNTEMNSAVAYKEPWQRELSQAIRDPQALLRALDLPPSLLDGAVAASETFQLMVTQSFLSRMVPGDVHDPLLRQILPLADELKSAPGFTADPLQESAAEAAPGLVQKYGSRVLFITTGSCAINCRYCFRREYPYPQVPKRLEDLTPAMAAIESDNAISEVILSGGDPLILNDRRLTELVTRLERIEHVTTLRIHTRLPIVLPSRVTTSLSETLRNSRLQPVVVVHSNHPNEIVDDCATALSTLVRSGIPTLNQSVLLRGINDDSDVLIELSRRLVQRGVMPYYLHRPDHVTGTAHFEVSDETGRQIIADMRRQLPGYAVPRFVVEEPTKPHKTVIA